MGHKMRANNKLLIICRLTKIRRAKCHVTVRWTIRIWLKVNDGENWEHKIVILSI